MQELTELSMSRSAPAPIDVRPSVRVYYSAEQQ